MAKCVTFDGANRHFLAIPMEKGDFGLNPQPEMFGFSNGIITYSRWKLTPEEAAEIAKTGEVWIAVRCGQRPMQAHWLGSISTIKAQCLDFGRFWKRKPKPRLLEDKRAQA
jgi:hypothetical protein